MIEVASSVFRVIGTYLSVLNWKLCHPQLLLVNILSSPPSLLSKFS